jgi:hypothetical protein
LQNRSLLDGQESKASPVDDSTGSHVEDTGKKENTGGSKLPTPVANAREAFCARGCFSSFYLHRCIVCERAIEQPKRGRRLICKRAKCRNLLAGGLSLGRYHHAQSAKLISVKADSVDVLTAPATDIAAPAWRIVAGPELIASQFHCATIADGPNSEWKGGEYQRW